MGWNIDDYYRNPNNNERDHLAGRLTDQGQEVALGDVSEVHCQISSPTLKFIKSDSSDGLSKIFIGMVLIILHAIGFLGSVELSQPK